MLWRRHASGIRMGACPPGEFGYLKWGERSVRRPEPRAHTPSILSPHPPWPTVSHSNQNQDLCTVLLVVSCSLIMHVHGFASLRNNYSLTQTACFPTFVCSIVHRGDSPPGGRTQTQSWKRANGAVDSAHASDDCARVCEPVDVAVFEVGVRSSAYSST